MKKYLPWILGAIIVGLLIYIVCQSKGKTSESVDLVEKPEGDTPIGASDVTVSTTVANDHPEVVK